MKLNKLLIICLILLISISGCAKNENNNAMDNDKTAKSKNEPYGKFTANGKIVKMDDEGFHIQSGENVDVYNVDAGRSSNFFIGDYVALTSLDGDIFDVAIDEEYDYSGIDRSIFDEASKLNVRVAEISRDETGAMRIYGLAADNKEYDIVSNADTVTNFARSTLKVDDEIFVYPKKLSGDIPAVVEAEAIFNKDDNWQNKYYALQ